jgi:LasA protease
MRRHTHSLIFLLLILLVPALACNLPTVTPSYGSSRDLPGEALRQTMRASTQVSYSLTTPQPTISVENFPTMSPEPAATANSPQLTPHFTQPPVIYDPGEFYDYYARPGDTLDGVAGRFGVDPQEISSPQPLLARGFLPHGQKLLIPNLLDEVTAPDPLLPDSELVYSPSAANFDVESFVRTADGYLSSYQGLVNEELLSGAEIVQKVANDLSVNPRLLLGIIEYRIGWVYGQLESSGDLIYPLGFGIEGRTGLYQELMIAATQLNKAYYGWRQGTFTDIRYNDGTHGRLNPQLSAGSAALQHLFAMFHRPETWQRALYGEESFPARYRGMLGDYWARAEAVEPLIPAELGQPLLELPFVSGELWSMTAGPHEAWNAGTPRGALDFSPTTGGAVCAVSSAWATASAPGMIVRSSHNTVALDLDGDGYEGSGWVLVYLHLAREGLVEEGKRVEQDDPLGHPSCEGGRSTGKHVHLARKYNGEWLPADGPLPFILSGWFAHADDRNYHGTLVRGDQIVSSDINGGRTSIITR